MALAHVNLSKMALAIKYLWDRSSIDYLEEGAVGIMAGWGCLDHAGFADPGCANGKICQRPRYWISRMFQIEYVESSHGGMGEAHVKEKI